MTAKRRNGRKPRARKQTAPQQDATEKSGPETAPAEPTPGALVTQPHGGALRYGSEPGNTPGAGRPPSIVRARARSGFYDRIPTLEKIADNDKTAAADRIRAIAVLGKIGVDGGKVNVEEVRLRMRHTLDVIRAQLTPEDAHRVIEAIRPIWI